jgi:hypothetical protein
MIAATIPEFNSSQDCSYSYVILSVVKIATIGPVISL